MSPSCSLRMWTCRTPHCDRIRWTGLSPVNSIRRQSLCNWWSPLSCSALYGAAQGHRSCLRFRESVLLLISCRSSASYSTNHCLPGTSTTSASGSGLWLSPRPHVQKKTFLDDHQQVQGVVAGTVEGTTTAGVVVWGFCGTVVAGTVVGIAGCRTLAVAAGWLFAGWTLGTAATTGMPPCRFNR